MHSFRQIVLATVVALASVSAAHGQANTTTQYRDALRQCGADWKASEARKTVEKGKGMAAWQEFRAKCVIEKGWNGKKATPSRSA